MSTKTFELKVLISLINGTLFHDTVQADIDEVVMYVHGDTASVTDADTVDRTIERIVQNHPKVVAAAQLMERHTVLDQARYNKLCELYCKGHKVRSLVVEEVLDEIEA